MERWFIMRFLQGEETNKPWFIACANFHGVHTSTTSNFKLLQGHWIQRLETHSISSKGQVQTGSNTNIPLSNFKCLPGNWSYFLLKFTSRIYHQIWFKKRLCRSSSISMCGMNERINGIIIACFTDLILQWRKSSCFERYPELERLGSRPGSVL